MGGERGEGVGGAGVEGVGGEERSLPILKDQCLWAKTQKKL